MICFPDTPNSNKAFYLSEQEKRRAIERVVEDGREEKGNFTWDLFARVMKSWQLYVLTILWMYAVLQSRPTHVTLTIS